MPRGKKTHGGLEEHSSIKAEVCAVQDNDSKKAVMEKSTYKDETFPVVIRTRVYSSFIENDNNCHWHNDLEFGVLLEGHVDYHINGSCIKLRKGDGLFVNSNVLHMVRKLGSEDAVLYTLTFPAALLYSGTNSTIYKKYFESLISKRIEGFKILVENPLGSDMAALLMKIYNLDPSCFGYELECQEFLNRLWLLNLHYIDENKAALLQNAGDMRHAERMKAIISYIHEHFNEKINVEDIAKHVNISRGECFRCFKKFSDKRIIEYINEYRMKRAIWLLRETDKSVIDISSECGFENVSYFGKLFKDEFSMTPFQYKKAHIWTNNTLSKINGYDYEYWKDSGNGTMVIPVNASNGSFSCDWGSVNNISFRSGKKFKNRNLSHSQIGRISLEFDTAYDSDNFFFGVYGWTVAPLVEWYIIEYYAAYKPMTGAYLGTHNSDGGIYEIYHDTRECMPSIHGVNTFEQYWSVRTTRRFGGKTDVSAHFLAWESMGLRLGNLAELALVIESWQGGGSAKVNTNIITIDG